MVNLLKNRRVIIIGVICVVILLGIITTRTMLNRETSREIKNNVYSNEYNATALLKYKTPYVGDNSKVVNLIDNLRFANLRREVSLETKSKPYGISVNYDFRASSFSLEAIKTILKNNATVMFALIDNVDVISFNLGMLGEGQKYQGTTQVIRTQQNFQVTRMQLQQGYSQDLRHYSKDVTTLETLLNSFSLSLFAYPEKYAMTMSSVPGIRISAEYDGTADMVQYSTKFGSLSTWDNKTGKINTYGQKAELPFTTPVYWSPSSNGPFKDADKNAIKVSVFNKNTFVAEKQVNIRFDETMHYTVDTSTGDVIVQNDKFSGSLNTPDKINIYADGKQNQISSSGNKFEQITFNRINELINVKMPKDLSTLKCIISDKDLKEVKGFAVEFIYNKPQSVTIDYGQKEKIEFTEIIFPLTEKWENAAFIKGKDNVYIPVGLRENLDYLVKAIVK